MTHHVHPYSFRLGYTTNWKSRWFSLKKYQKYLREDTFLRGWLEKKLKPFHVEAVEIERSPALVHLIVKTARPGMLIGRGGEGAEKLKEEIKKQIFRISKKFKEIPEKEEVKLTIEEIRFPESRAAVAAQMIADEIEKRTPFRRVMKQSLDKVSAVRGVKGVKIVLKGRLDGAEMARYEWVKSGRIPLQTLRADIDYAEKTAYTTYGTVGVRVWIYKGDIFEKEKKDGEKF